MRLLFFGTYDTAAHPRVGVLRDGMRERGADVLECNVPLGLSTAARVSMLRNPAGLPRLVWRLALSWTGLLVQARRVRRDGAWPDAVVVGYLGHFDVLLARRLFPHVPVVLDHLIGASDTATDRGVAGGWRQRLLRRLDDAALGAADIVVVDTDEHLSALPPSVRRRAVVVPVGAPQQWFDAYAGPPAGTREPGAPLRAVFFGLFTPLQGAPVIGEALGKLAGAPVHVTMVGTGQELAETRQGAGFAAAQPGPHQGPHQGRSSDARSDVAAGKSGVTWLDWVPADDLPALVASHDVCLGIFGVGPKAGRVVPNKLFQGAAAGCALVTSDTPPQRRALGNAALFVSPGDAAALAETLLSLAADPALLQGTRAAARRLALESFTPAQVVGPLLHRLLPVVPPKGVMPVPTTSDSAALPPLSPNAWLRWDVVSRLLPPPNPSLRVLEVGCGQGGFGARLAQRYDYLGVEPDAMSASVAAARVAAVGAGEVRRGDLSVVREDETFDLVCAFEVIEHIEDDAAAMREWVGRLRPGGTVLLSTPAWQKRFGPADEMVGHYRRYDPPVLRDLLTGAGLADVELVHFGAPLGYALEAGRNAVGKRRLAVAGMASAADSPGSTAGGMAERSSASGRTLQPGRPWAAAAARLGTVPFRTVQRAFPRSGPGLVARGRRPLP